MMKFRNRNYHSYRKRHNLIKLCAAFSILLLLLTGCIPNEEPIIESSKAITSSVAEVSSTEPAETEESLFNKLQAALSQRFDTVVERDENNKEFLRVKMDDETFNVKVNYAQNNILVENDYLLISLEYTPSELYLIEYTNKQTKNDDELNQMIIQELLTVINNTV